MLPDCTNPLKSGYVIRSIWIRQRYTTNLMMIVIHLMIPSSAFACLVEKRGIEPRISACKADVIPFNYNPICSKFIYRVECSAIRN